jgi:hypothetical protein
MHISYEGSSAAGKGILSRIDTPEPYDVPPGGLGEPFPHSLTFDSEFESGNLHRVVQRGDYNYDLFLRGDLHTAGHTQWFYFAVSNTHTPEEVELEAKGEEVSPVTVSFNIVNLTKPDSLFNLGMRPVIYSCVDASTSGIGWVRAGSNISYYVNSYPRNNTAGEGDDSYYTLSFSIEFKHAKDTVLIAYSYPYTYSDYKHHINMILSRPNSSSIIKRAKLCTTLGGEACDLLVITNFDSEKERIGPVSVEEVDLNIGKDGRDRERDDSRKTTREFRAAKLKPALFFSGRVHPGETPASWMMKGMLDFLTSASPKAQLLRQEFVIYIVPMLNPDGVIFGNNRCSLAGVDLNRQWKTPVRSLHPTVYYLKSFMMFQSRIRTVMMYVDLHGHSRKYNVFMYGCEEKKKPKSIARAFPKFFSMHEVGQKYVSYQDCSFHVKKGRESTARVVVAKEMNISRSYTLEATFSGVNYGPLKFCHLHVGHLQEIGASLCDAILRYFIAERHVKDTLMSPMVNRSNSLRSLNSQTPSGYGEGTVASSNSLTKSISNNNCNDSSSVNTITIPAVHSDGNNDGLNTLRTQGSKGNTQPFIRSSSTIVVQGNALTSSNNNASISSKYKTIYSNKNETNFSPSDFLLVGSNGFQSSGNKMTKSSSSCQLESNASTSTMKCSNNDSDGANTSMTIWSKDDDCHQDHSQMGVDDSRLNHASKATNISFNGAGSARRNSSAIAAAVAAIVDSTKTLYETNLQLGGDVEDSTGLGPCIAEETFGDSTNPRNALGRVTTIPVSI